MRRKIFGAFVVSKGDGIISFCEYLQRTANCRVFLRCRRRFVCVYMVYDIKKLTHLWARTPSDGTCTDGINVTCDLWPTTHRPLARSPINQRPIYKYTYIDWIIRIMKLRCQLFIRTFVRQLESDWICEGLSMYAFCTRRIRVRFDSNIPSFSSNSLAWYVWATSDQLPFGYKNISKWFMAQSSTKYFSFISVQWWIRAKRKLYVFHVENVRREM